MKKIMLFPLMLFFMGSMYAQQVSGSDELIPDGTAPVNFKEYYKKLSAGQFKEQAIGWLIPSWNLLDYWETNAGVSHYANVIFPDSTATYESQGNVKHNWLNSVGGTFEPYSEIFDSLGFLLINPTDPYRIDSIFVLAWYNVVNSAVVDTLVLELVKGNPHTAPEFAWTVFNFPDDTIDVSPAKVFGSTTQTGFLCRMTAPSKTVIKYPLSLNDSTNYYGKYITIPVNYDVPAGKVVGLSVTFVPGTTYSFGDLLYSYSHTLTPVLNSIRMGLFATDNTTLDPHVFHDPFGHWNSHHFIRKEIRYSMYTGSNAWRNERMASTVSWGFDIGYFVTNTAPGAGIENLNLSAVSIYPNPVNQKLNLDRVPLNTEVKIFDILGNCIYRKTVDQGREMIDLDGVSAGCYFIQMTRNNEVTSRKIIVGR